MRTLRTPWRPFDSVECPMDSYAHLQGKSDCTSCGSNRNSPKRWTTFKQASNRRVNTQGRQESSPVTAKGFQLWKDNCESCSVGMICGGMESGWNSRVLRGMEGHVHSAASGTPLHARKVSLARALKPETTRVSLAAIASRNGSPWCGRCQAAAVQSMASCQVLQPRSLCW